MEIHLTAKHLKVTAPINDYVQQKMERAQKYFDHIIWGQAILSVEKRAHNCEFLIHAPKQTFRALATAADLYSAIDLASDKIDAQIKKFKERLKGRHKGRGAEIGPQTATSGPLKLQVVKQSVVPIKPEEAVEEMEALGQTFRLFQDQDSQQIHVVYRASDESYKILQPVKKSGR